MNVEYNWLNNGIEYNTFLYPFIFYLNVLNVLGLVIIIYNKNVSYMKEFDD